MIFGTNKLHKATNGMLLILLMNGEHARGHHVYLHVYFSYWLGIFRESRKLLRTTLTYKTVSW